jgi:hypothetical protein
MGALGLSWDIGRLVRPLSILVTSTVARAALLLRSSTSLLLLLLVFASEGLGLELVPFAIDVLEPRVGCVRD